MGIVDISVFIFYGIIVILAGNYLFRSKEKEASARDYFFADRSLPWFVVGSSIIAANISAEQFIGMSGSGYAIGLAIATYEWIAALILIVVAKYFLPVFIENNIFTMPQFLALRYDNRIKTILAVFWLMLFIFVNLSSILYLGAITLKSVFGISMVLGIIGLAVFSLLYTIINGLKAIANTDIIQVFFLLGGGIVTTWLAVDKFGGNQGIFTGFKELYSAIPEKFHMIVSNTSENYKYLPGWRAIFGGIWIAGIYYFGANQYIIQKAFGAKSLREAQKGMVFAGYLKLILPFVVVIPGITAYAFHADLAKPDEAYPWLLANIIPAGLKGLIFAALIAAIVSSFSAIINSASTIFTMDIYKTNINRQASESEMVKTGRISSLVICALAIIVALSLGNLQQAFQYIQEYTGMISPGITAIFVMGMFWKKTTSTGAFWGTLLSIPVSAIIKFSFRSMPFLDQMLVAFFIVAALITVISVIGKKDEPSRGLTHQKGMFTTGPVFNVFSVIIVLIFSFIYISLW